MAENWKVSSKADLFQTPVVIEDPFALPPGFTAIGDREDGLHVEVDVEVERTRSRIRRIRIETTSDRDLSSTTLREIPVRDLVVNAAADVLWEMEWNPKTKSAAFHPHAQRKGGLSEEAFRALARSIGFIPVPQ